MLRSAPRESISRGVVFVSVFMLNIESFSPGCSFTQLCFVTLPMPPPFPAWRKVAS